MLVNNYNFIKWDDDLAGQLDPIPWFYGRDQDRDLIGAPIAVPGEAMAFYITTNDGLGFDFPNFADIKIYIRDWTGADVSTDAGLLEKQDLLSGNYHIYSTFVWPTLPNGWYQLRLYNTDTSTLHLYSPTWIRVVNADGASGTDFLEKQTCYFRFRNDRQFYGINYFDIPDFHQQFRLPAGATEFQVEGDQEIYKEATTGKGRIMENYLNKVIKIETYYFDQAGHVAAALMFNHKYLEINGLEYQAKAVYKVLTDPKSLTSRGEIDLIDYEFASANRC